MTPTSNLVPLARDLLVAAGRPLNVRRLFALGREQAIWPEGLTSDRLFDALHAGGDAAGIEAVRRSVFRIKPAEGEAETPAALAAAVPQAEPERPAAPRRASRNAPDDDNDGRDRRRRRTRTVDLLGGAPAAPVSVEEAMDAARRAHVDPQALRASLWARMLSRAADVVGDPVEEPLRLDPITERPQPVAPPAPPTPPVTPAPAAEAVEPAVAEPAVAEPAVVEPSAPAPRRTRPSKAARPTPEPAPVVEGDAHSERPFVQARQADTPYEGADRRHATLPQLDATSTVVEVAARVLSAAPGPMTFSLLAQAVRGEGIDPQGLSAVIRSENARLVEAGLRPRFDLHDGRVDVVSRRLSPAYLALEAKLHETLAEQRQMVCRDLLAQVGALESEGFERVARLVMERAGYTGVDVVVRRGGNLLLTAQRPASGARIAILARQSWAPTEAGTVRALRSGLTAFGAEMGMLVTLGAYSACAHEAAAEEGAPVELIDGAGFADALWRRGVGLAVHRPAIRFVDGAFFAALTDDQG